MKNRTPLITAALLVSLLCGCSKQKQLPIEEVSDSVLPIPASPNAKYTDLGVVEIANDKKSRHDLGDGRVCIIGSFILTGQRIALIMAIEERDSKGAVRLIPCPNIEAKSDKPVEFAVGDIGVRFTPHIKP